MERIAIIGTVGLPAKYGGFETLAQQLVQNLNSKCKFTVYCSGKVYKKGERPKKYKKARLFYLPLRANGVQSILYDMLSMLHALFYADTLLILGVSGGLLIPFLRLFTRKKIIVNIDGLEWRRAKWNRFARAFLRFSERVAVRWSHADIADNEVIKKYTSKNYGTLSHLIEYGGDHVKPHGPTKGDHLKYDFLFKPYAFKVARIEPENNIHMILEGFLYQGYPLVVVGNWNASSYGRQLKEKYGHLENFYLLDPIYDQWELDLLRANCFVYVHGHGAGGTNPSLVEAMNLGLPILAFKCSFNVATTENEAIYFKSEKELKQQLAQTSFHQWICMKGTMRSIAKRRYVWKVVAEKYFQLVLSLNHSKTKRAIQGDLSNYNENVLLRLGLAHLKRPLYYYEND